MRRRRTSVSGNARRDAIGVVLPECLEPRAMLSATVFRHGDVGWFVDPAKPEIDRYDIAAERWLDPVVLRDAPGPATAALVDEDGVVAAFGNRIYRYAADGTSPTWLFATQQDVVSLHSDGRFLFVVTNTATNGRVTSVDKTTNAIVDTRETWSGAFAPTSIATGMNKILGHDRSGSSSSILTVTYDDTGHFTGAGNNWGVSGYPTATATWVSPDGTRVLDDSGTAYSTDTLGWSKSLGTRVTDVGFVGNAPIAVAGTTLAGFSASWLPTGRAEIGFSASNVFLGQEDAIAFLADPSEPSGWRTKVVPLADIVSPDPGPPADPVGLAFVPDLVARAADGTVLLCSAAESSIFRWVPSTGKYAATIPLLGTPSHFAHAPALEAVFVAYANGEIDRIDLRAETPRQVPLVVLPGRPGGLSAAGPYVFAEDDTGAWATHYTIDTNGRVVHSRDWVHYSEEYVWSDATRSMYFLRDDQTPNDLIREPINVRGDVPDLPPGGIGSPIDSPLHTSDGFTHPIRVKPDGSVVVLGSGAVHDATTLARLPYAVPAPFVDAGWLRGNLFTVAPVDGGSRVARYRGDRFEPFGSVTLAGTPLSLLPLDPPRAGTSGAAGRLLAVTSVGGVPTFTMLRPDLSVQKPLIDTDLDGNGRSDVLLRDAESGAVTATFRDAAGAVVATRPLGGGPDWEIVVAADFGGDAVSDILWRHVPSGTTVLWQMAAGGNVTQQNVLGGDARWRVAAAGDYDGDGREDLLWRDMVGGSVAVWLMNGSTVRSHAMIAGGTDAVVQTSDPDWTILPVANAYDADGDGISDLLWQHRGTGSTALWHMNGTRAPSQALLGGDSTWKIVGAADLDGDGRGDLLWKHLPSGGAAAWLMADTAYRASAAIEGSRDSTFVVAYDVNGDGTADTAWADNATGVSTVRLSRGLASLGIWPASPSTKWTVLRRPVAAGG